ncbi:MAG: glycosyltransferase family 1 protein [Hydrogenophaga sp.]|jgi:glycosyltransferase involved in cell wall biosynthesis|uniref:glycosyltransferase family 4 protein n=1 Tax=Hydrogenophaga sp. TaxID=1904254 RepID=UPI002608EEFB|nr:glycosyltransferase family 1 protein [Hydrogenophaga sp.]MCV0437311.1 glycosyltransferase family 1 protein [Hydrogenophaga sp.]
MKILIVTDAWHPQVSGVVTTLAELVRQLQVHDHEVVVIQPGQFRTRPCPGHAGINLALFPGRRLRQLMDAAEPDAIHIATEGPLGWAARGHCLRRGLRFTTAFHTKFPEILHAALHVPLSWGYALLRRFHRPSSGVMVPTQGVLDMLKARGFRHLRAWTHGVDSRLFALADAPETYPPLGSLAHPVSLYVGRIAPEKNIEAFLRLDVPGSKVVCGVGPMQSALRQRYPYVHWLGVLPRHELARVYAAADVFVFPSRSETFGLVMLEAMACGVPVAAYPVDGPLQVIGDSGGGAMREDLREAWNAALKIKRHEARDRALHFGWGRAATLFVSYLSVLNRPSRLRPGVGLTQEGGTKLSHKRHPVVE